MGRNGGIDKIDRYTAEVRWLTDYHLSALEAVKYHSNTALSTTACIDATAIGIVLSFTMRRHVENEMVDGHRVIQPDPCAVGAPSDVASGVMVSALASQQFADRATSEAIEAAIHRIMVEMKDALDG